MYKLLDHGVLRLHDNACIPQDNYNVDWQQYQEWLAEGNRPLPKDPERVSLDPAQLKNQSIEIQVLADIFAELIGTTQNEVNTRFAIKYPTKRGNNER